MVWDIFSIYNLVEAVWLVLPVYAANGLVPLARGRRPLDFGRKFIDGKPLLGPGKTVEGALGGIVAGTLAGLVAKGVFDVFWPELSAAFPWAVAIPFGIVLSLVGVVGDLVESLLKRDAAMKDTGALLPGMGGVLDRIDSPLLGIPIMYYLLLGYLFARIG